MNIIILAAGMGTRLNKNKPKCLTTLSNGETILQRQINALLGYVDKKDITIVVGYKKNMIQKKYSDYSFIFNSNYENTNTAKSLLYALDSKQLDSDFIWLNGDVVFDPEILKPIFELKKSSMLVNTNSVGAEEVKYNVNDDGTINKVSKNIHDGLGEAVGINKISSFHVKQFKHQLEKCGNNDYFEYAIELLINKNIKIYPIDISNFFCCEIDTQYDLNFVNEYLEK